MSRLLLALILTVTPILAASDGETASKPISFPDLPALREWAKKTSIGGCNITMVSYDGKQAAVVSRMQTSGIRSDELTVFVPWKDRWVEGLRLREYWGDFLDVGQHDDLVRISLNRTKAEVLSFSISGLNAQPSEK